MLPGLDLADYKEGTGTQGRAPGAGVLRHAGAGVLRRFGAVRSDPGAARRGSGRPSGRRGWTRQTGSWGSATGWDCG